MFQQDLASLAGDGTVFARNAAEKLGRLRAELGPLARRYDVVVANPPYMGSGNMNKWLGSWVKETYKDAKNDLCTCFIERGRALAIVRGYVSMITASSWMFISSFESFRKKLLATSSICSMIQQSTHGYAGVTVPTTMFVLAQDQLGVTGSYIRLEDFDRPQWQEPKALEALANPGCGWFYRIDSVGFEAIPGSPIAYWLSARSISAFKGRQCSDLFTSVGRTKTHNNEKYLRRWWEVSVSNKDSRWHPYANGGGFSRWAGLESDLVDWSTSAIAEYELHGGLPNMRRCNEPGICWGLITSSKTSFRVKPPHFKYSSGSPTIMSDKSSVEFTALAFLNSSVAEGFLRALNPTLNTTVSDVMSLPCPSENEHTSIIAEQCIELVRMDWDSYETAWQFERHPLV